MGRLYNYEKKSYFPFALLPFTQKIFRRPIPDAPMNVQSKLNPNCFPVIKKIFVKTLEEIIFGNYFIKILG